MDYQVEHLVDFVGAVCLPEILGRTARSAAEKCRCLQGSTQSGAKMADLDRVRSRVQDRKRSASSNA